MQERGASRALARREPSSCASAPACRVRNAGEVPRDGGIRRVRQAELRQAARARAVTGRASRATCGKKPSTSVLRHLVARQLGAQRRRRAAPSPREAIAMGAAASAASASSRSLATRHACTRLACCHRSSALPSRLELLPHEVREREVHVVAAEQDVVAHGDAHELQRAVPLDRRDGAEVASSPRRRRRRA